MSNPTNICALTDATVGPVTAAVTGLLRQMWEKPQSSLDPASFLDPFLWETHRGLPFRDLKQHDSLEFLHQLLDTLHGNLLILL